MLAPHSGRAVTRGCAECSEERRFVLDINIQGVLSVEWEIGPVDEKRRFCGASGRLQIKSRIKKLFFSYQT